MSCVAIVLKKQNINWNVTLTKTKSNELYNHVITYLPRLNEIDQIIYQYVFKVTIHLMKCLGNGISVRYILCPKLYQKQLRYKNLVFTLINHKLEINSTVLS